MRVARLNLIGVNNDASASAVVGYDAQSLQVTGEIPSDHCMVRATLVIP